jgi:hypothetical protein
VGSQRPPRAWVLNWGREAVALSSRHFLVAPDGSLYRLANAKFDRMLRDPNGTVLPTFAGQRVHMAELVVELAGRAALRVVRRTFAVLPFDDGGRMDSARFLKQQWARAESGQPRQPGQCRRRCRSVRRARRGVETCKGTGAHPRRCRAWANRLSARVVARVDTRSGQDSGRDCAASRPTGAVAGWWVPWRDRSGALLQFVVHATIVVIKAMRNNDEDF